MKKEGRVLLFVNTNSDCIAALFQIPIFRFSGLGVTMQSWP
jgi:hypothetical protein